MKEEFYNFRLIAVCLCSVSKPETDKAVPPDIDVEKRDFAEGSI